MSISLLANLGELSPCPKTIQAVRQLADYGAAQVVFDLVDHGIAAAKEEFGGLQPVPFLGPVELRG